MSFVLSFLKDSTCYFCHLVCLLLKEEVSHEYHQQWGEKVSRRLPSYVCRRSLRISHGSHISSGSVLCPSTWRMIITRDVSSMGYLTEECRLRDSCCWLREKNLSLNSIGSSSTLKAEGGTLYYRPVTTCYMEQGWGVVYVIKIWKKQKGKTGLPWKKWNLVYFYEFLKTGQ